MHWHHPKNWTRLRVNAPVDVHSVTGLGSRLNTALREIDAEKFHEDAGDKDRRAEYRAHAVKTVRRKLDRLMGRVLTELEKAEEREEDDADVEERVEAVRKDFRIRKKKINEIQEQQLDKDSSFLNQIETFMSQMMDVYDNLVYHPLEDAVDAWEDGMDRSFYNVWLEKVWHRTGTLYEEKINADELDLDPDESSDEEIQMEAADEFADELIDTDLPV